MFNNNLQNDDRVPTPPKITGVVRSLDKAFARQGVMKMDSGMDCPLAQVFKRRRVHREKEVTASSHGAYGDEVGHREGRVQLNQGVSDSAVSDIGHLRLDGDISQILHIAQSCLDKGKQF